MLQSASWKQAIPKMLKGSFLLPLAYALILSASPLFVDANETATVSFVKNIATTTNLSDGTNPVFLSLTRGVALDQSGNMYVLDGNYVKKFNSSGAYMTTFGGPGSGNGQLNVADATIAGITTDSSGNVYVADVGNNRIMKFDSSGAYVTKWGSLGSGSTQFNAPNFVFIATTTIYISDSNNSRIQEYNLTGTTLLKSITGISGIVSVVVDSAGNLYIATGDCNGQKLDPNGGHLVDFGDSCDTIAQVNTIGVDSAGTIIYAADGGDGTIIKFDASGSQLGNLTPVTATQDAIVVDGSGNVYTAEHDFGIAKYDSSDSLVKTWQASGNANGQFSDPKYVTVDGSGNIYVTDRANSRIQKLNSSGTYVTKWGSSGSADGQFILTSSGGGTAIDGSGNIFLADGGNNRVQKFDSAGSFISKFGSTGSGNGQFSGLEDIAVSSTSIYVADGHNNRIQKFDLLGNYQTKWGSSGASDGQFGNFPKALAVDQNGNVYVADSGNHRIQVFNSEGTFLRKWGSSGSGDGQLGFPDGITVDLNGYIYVSDYNNNRVQKFTSTGTYVGQFGSKGDNDGDLYGPGGLDIDSAGQNIFVPDGFNNRIVQFHIDLTSPSVSITSPTDGSIVSGTTTVTATSTDDSSGVAGVHFYVDSTSLGAEDTVAPYSIDWDTTAESTGSHTVMAVARDVANNYATTTISVNVNQSSPPTVTVSAPTSVTASTAVFNGNLTATGGASVTKLGFNYGTSVSYGSSASSTSGSFSTGAYLQSISSLSCGTLYHVQAFGVNIAGTGTSSDTTFTTSSCPATPPTVTTQSASSVGVFSAAFNGNITSLNTGGNASARGFVYGLTSTYTATSTASGSFSTGAFSHTVPSLSCNTTYHYAAYATNSGGVAYGSDSSFTTSACAGAPTGSDRTDYYGYSDVLLVVNDASATSTAIANYFALSRGISTSTNEVHLTTVGTEGVTRSEYNNNIKGAIESFLTAHSLTNSINYVVLTKGVPLYITDTYNSVDSELMACLTRSPCTGQRSNPFYNATDVFSRNQYGVYLVTRLDGYTVAQVESLIDRSSLATTTAVTPGQFILDVDPGRDNSSYHVGNDWMRAAGPILTNRGFTVNLNETSTFVTGQSSVQGYYSWGSNDTSLGGNNFTSGNSYKNGSIAETIVSTSGRTFAYPPTYGQSLIADLIAEGVTGAKGYVSEPYLSAIAHADILFDRYSSGSNMAESFYAASSVTNWKDVVVGDPKMALLSHTPFGPIAPVDNFTTSVNNGVTFSWSDEHIYPSGVKKYQLFIDGALSQDNLVGTSTAIGPTLSVGAHTWYIKAFDNSGSFVASTTLSNLNIVDVPSAFGLTSPADGLSTTTASQTFAWNASTDSYGIRKYQLYIDGALAQDNIDSGTLSVAVTLAVGSHSWYVRAIDNHGLFTQSSSTRTVNIASSNMSQLAIQSLAASVGTSTATVTWDTNNAASTRLFYGPSNLYGSATSLDSSLVTSHSVSLSGLVPCAEYHYEASSTDAVFSNAVSSDHTFTTTGCTGSDSIAASSEQNVPVSGGGTISFTDINSHALTVSVPSGFTNSGSSATFQVKQLDAPQFFSTASGVPSTKQIIDLTVYNIKALSDSSTALTTFVSPISITMSYDESDIANVTESGLAIYRYDSGVWTALDDCSVDTVGNTVTCATSHFSDFVIMGSPSSESSGGNQVELPPTSTDQTTHSYTSGGGGGGAPNPANLPPFKVVCPVGYVCTPIATTTPALSPAPTGQKASFSRDLEVGVSGSDVKSLQIYLNGRGYKIANSGAGAPGHETTTFGSLTKRALMRFQREHGIPSTGFFGPITRKFVNAHL